MLIKPILPFILLTLFAKSLRADDFSIAQQFVNGTTIAVAKIDSKRMSVPDSFSKTISDQSELQRGAKPIVKVLKELIAAVNGESVFIAVDVPFSSAQSPVRLYIKNTPNLNSTKLVEHLERLQFTKPVVQGDYVCFSLLRPTESSSKVVIAETIMTSARPDLKLAMQAVQEFPIQVLVLPPEYLWATFRDLMPTLPKQFGGGPTTVLTEGVRWSAIGIDPAQLQLKSVTQSNSTEAAKTLATRLPGILSASASQMRFPLSTVGFDKLIPMVKPIVTGDQLMVSINGLSELDQTVSFMTSAMAQVLGPMTNQVKMDRFRQIGLALHNFDSANTVFPPSKAGRDAEGKSNLSWRVHILPYIDQMELYSQFHMKEAWNSEHNLKLLEKMPDIYKGSVSGLDAYNEIKSGYTTFLAPVGEGTIFGGLKPVRMNDITDGTSNTIWLVEVKAEYAKPWTAPEDYAFEVANPAKGLAEIAADKPSFLAAVADGSVAKFPLSISAETLVHLFQMNDGNAISW